jgi:uncharacterized protein
VELATVIDAVEERATTTAMRSNLHGPRHWRDVARIGRLLRLKGIGADPLVVFLFALIHDSQRTNDGHDPEHGRRAATLAEEMRTEGLLRLTNYQASLLTSALAGHADGQVTDDPTIGTCWDADRLNLWRVGIEPEEESLSTWPARDCIQVTRDFHTAADANWLTIAPGADR